MFKIFDKLEKFSIEPNTFKSIIVGLSFGLPLVDFIYLYTLQSSNLSNMVTILTSIFTVLITFISIIFVYFNCFNQTLSDKLSELLHKIEYFSNTYTNVDKKKQNHQFNPKISNHQFENAFDYLKLLFYKYKTIYAKNEDRILSINRLYTFCKIISFLAILILIIDFIIINILPLFIIISFTAILIFNLIVTKKIIALNYISFPSPQQLLTPSTVLDEQFCNIYELNRYLPIKLFHVSTSFLIGDLSDYLNNIKNEKSKEAYKNNSKYSENDKNYLILYSLLPFKLNNISLTYNYNPLEGSQFIDRDSLNIDITPNPCVIENLSLELKHENILFIPRPIVDDFKEKKFSYYQKRIKSEGENAISDIDDIDIDINEIKKNLSDYITLTIFFDNNEKFECLYLISKIISSQSFLFYAPTVINPSNPNTKLKSDTQDIFLV